MEQKYQIGDVVQHNGGVGKVVAVRYQEDDQFIRHSFEYVIESGLVGEDGNIVSHEVKTNEIVGIAGGEEVKALEQQVKDQQEEIKAKVEEANKIAAEASASPETLAVEVEETTGVLDTVGESNNNEEIPNGTEEQS